MGITHVVPDKVRDLWNEEDIRVLVLLSLLLQTLLIFLAPLRKRTASKLLTFALWSFYLGADYVAILALGNILSGQTASDDSSQPNSDAQLMAFWAPFLLLHLGGPDTITSFSQEDNDLWLRHLLGLVVQISVTFLVLLASSFSSRLLLAGSVLVFVAGFIKFAERTWALRLASKEKIEDTLDYLGVTGEHLFDKPEIVAIISQSSLPDSEPLTEPLLISTAHYFFAKFTRPRLLARYVRGDDDVINRCSPLFIQICNTVQAFCMVEVELSFFHDSIAWRCLNLMLAIAALLIFQLSEKQGSKKSNLVITYTLVLGGIVLEMVSVLFLIFSDWTVSSLEERGFRRIAEAISKVTHCIFRKPKP
ncbi:hypothetical protein LUZ60_013508 [Juncus effusus]|nr:hypothetical protein LUZ60_013508 [Juncus effusus]